MTHAGSVASAIHQMMLEDPARRWDMATSATQLARIARVDATAIKPRVELAGTVVMPKPELAGTAFMAKRPVEPTRRLESGAMAAVLASRVTKLLG